MDVRCVIVFKNDSNILQTKTRIKLSQISKSNILLRRMGSSIYRKRRPKIEYIVCLWQLDECSGQYVWTSISFGEYVLNYDRRKLIAIKYAKKFDVPILYRGTPSKKDKKMFKGGSVKFFLSDLIKMRTVHGR